MPVDAVRLSDLWLKRELLYALLPEGQSTIRVSGKVLVECMRGPRGGLPELSRLMRGDALAGIKTDLYYLAALFEYFIVRGPENRINRREIEAFIEERGGTLALWPRPILGTFSDFANAALTLARTRPGWSAKQEEDAVAALGGVLRKALKDQVEDASDGAGKLRMLWGKKRNWVLSPASLDRIIRQPDNETPEIPEGDYVQIVVPAAATDQWVFGFELRADDEAVLAPWPKVGSWFSSRFQREGEAIALLSEYAEDERNPTAVELGRFSIRLVGVQLQSGINEPPRLPEALLRLTTDTPDWPHGYAEAMATVTFASRRNDAHVKALSRRDREERDLEPMPGQEVEVPERAKLYHTDYRVVLHE